MEQTGLTNDQVLQSRREHGTNVLTPPVRESVWRKFIGCFADPLIRILLVALLLSIGVAVYQYGWGDATTSVFAEPAGILAAILLATMVSFALELKNEKTFQALNTVNDDTLVKVVRDSNVTQVPRRDIVVGDIIILDTGEEIPADARLIDSFNLIVNESTLTGELQCNKSANPETIVADTTYPPDIIMKGCTIIEGYCRARVTAVGDATDAGRVFTAAQIRQGDQTPLGARLDRLSTVISRLAYGAAILIAIGRLVHYFIIEPTDVFIPIDFIRFLLNTLMIAVTFIVVAVPEGLPMSINMSLALSMKRLMREHTLPRTMHSCETMGAVTVICTDKTGTLTKNRMEVAEWRTLQGAEPRIAEAIAANSTANLDYSGPVPRTIGNPTEGALLLWLNNRGVNYLDQRSKARMIDRLPFNTERKYMATVVASGLDGRRTLYVKGAPELILTMCAVEHNELLDITDTLATMQAGAMRTLAMAYKVLDDDETAFTDGLVTASSLTFLAIMGINDPVREDVPGAIAQCREAGIDVKIVTGDVIGTSRAVAERCGIIHPGDNHIELTGTEFEAMTDTEIKKIINRIKILSRARPADKQRLTLLLKETDHVVAVTGDGTNDAPALNAANVGLSMGDGTAVAKESSDMTILDNSFGTICNAVMWGRSLYHNIQRFILFQMTINVVACLVVTIGAFLDVQSPLTVTQMLWVNLIMDTFAALALASLPPDPCVMHDKPRNPKGSIITPPMAKRVFGIGGALFVVLMLLLLMFKSFNITSFSHFVLHGNFLQGIDPEAWHSLTPYELTCFFTIFVLMQFWNMFNAKAFLTHSSSLHKISQCRAFMAIAGVIIVGQVLIVTFGGEMFNTVPISIADWLLIVAGTSPVLIIGAVYRLIKNHKQ